MNITEYQIETGRTRPALGSLKKDLLHMKLGVYTEIGEIIDIIKKNMAYGKSLDKVHIGEEIGDACWYIANEARLLNITLSTDIFYRENNRFSILLQLEDVIGALEDLLATYVRPDENHVEYHFRFVLLRQIAEFYGLNFNQILENNINKLKVRFPDKFEGSLAINKDVKAERAELEK